MPIRHSDSVNQRKRLLKNWPQLVMFQSLDLLANICSDSAATERSIHKELCRASNGILPNLLFPCNLSNLFSVLVSSYFSFMHSPVLFRYYFTHVSKHAYAPRPT